jgi:hypothetical protein
MDALGVGDLGKRLDTFRGGVLPRLMSVTAGGLALLLGLLPLLALLTTGGAERASRLVLLGIGFVVVGLVLLLRAGAQGGLRVEVHEGGLIRQRGGRAVTLHWEEVVSVRDESAPRRLMVTDRGGWCFAFEPSLGRFEELRRLIEAHTLPHLLAAVRSTVAAGRTAEFGAVSAGPEGIAWGEQIISWKDLGTVEVEPARGLLCITAGDATSPGGRPLARVEVERVDNLHVLLALVREKTAPA